MQSGCKNAAYRLFLSTFTAGMTKVLIITYYWPPSGGGGVQRWLKFSRYLQDMGIQPIVMAPENADYPVFDHSLEKEVFNHNLQVVKVPIWEPYKLLSTFKKDGKQKANVGITSNKAERSWTTKLAFWVRGNLLIPDPRKFWVNPVVKKAKALIDQHKIDVVITTGPPHSVHLAGLKLKKSTGIKWIADFRDPWSTIDYLDEFYLTNIAKKIHKKQERNVLLNADRVLAVSENWKRELEELGKQNVSVVTNGYDENDFAEYSPQTPRKFIISHVGFVSEYRIPKALMEVLNHLCEVNEEFASNLEIRFIGISGESLQQFLRQYSKLKGKFSFMDYLPHNKVIEAYGKSAILLLLLNATKNAAGHIPGKFFEYLASGKPIMAIGDIDGDVAHILQETRAGYIADFGDKREMEIILLKLFVDHQNQKVQTSSALIQEYSRKNLAKKLKKIIEELK